MAKKCRATGRWTKMVNRDGVAGAFGTLLTAVRLRSAEGDADCFACMVEFHRLRKQMWDVIEAKDDIEFPF